MNHSRFYLVDVTNPEDTQQIEITRSMPNDLMPTLVYDIPVELEVTRVKTVVGYGNIDTYIYATRPDLMEPEVDEGTQAISGRDRP
jgi:hypothetical protein